MTSFTAHSSSRNVLDSSCDERVDMNNCNDNKNNRNCKNSNYISNSSSNKVSEESKNVSDVALIGSYMCNFDNASSNQSDIRMSIRDINNNSSIRMLGRQQDSKLVNGKLHWPCKCAHDNNTNKNIIHNKDKNNKKMTMAIVKNENDCNACRSKHNNNNNNYYNTYDGKKMTPRQEFSSVLFDE